MTDDALKVLSARVARGKFLQQCIAELTEVEQHIHSGRDVTLDVHAGRKITVDASTSNKVNRGAVLAIVQATLAESRKDYAELKGAIE